MCSGSNDENEWCVSHWKKKGLRKGITNTLFTPTKGETGGR
jgi:hypothetical protein